MKKIKLSTAILDENEKEAERTRRYFSKRGIYCVNIMGAPGCGKTTLIRELIKAMRKKVRIAVIEGDVATGLDAEKIEKLGVPVALLNTDVIGNACHLTSKMIIKSFKKLNKKVDLLIIENIGNLVCPAEFDLGEHLRIAMTSISEGDDKVSKYPPMFMNAGAVIIAKTDLLPYFKYNLREVRREIKRLNPKAEIYEIAVLCKNSLKGLLTYLNSKLPGNYD